MGFVILLFLWISSFIGKKIDGSCYFQVYMELLLKFMLSSLIYSWFHSSREVFLGLLFDAFLVQTRLAIVVLFCSHDPRSWLQEAGEAGAQWL